MPNFPYSERLKHPEWQRKRLQIFERDEWKCRSCGSKNNTLHVHHLVYEKVKAPWDYDNDNFLTLCENCHTKETKDRYDHEIELLRTIKSRGLLIDDIGILIDFIDHMMGDLNSADNLSLFLFDLIICCRTKYLAKIRQLAQKYSWEELDRFDKEYSARKTKEVVEHDQ